MNNKISQYETFNQQLIGLLKGETNLIANLSNTAALYMQIFKPHWVGFYLKDGEDLVLGPFQGPVACTRIKSGKGVCGTSFLKQETIIVPNVHHFEGHIACSPYSNSEIVVPLFINNVCFGVLDIDAEHFNAFDKIDQEQIEMALKVFV